LRRPGAHITAAGASELAAYAYQVLSVAQRWLFPPRSSSSPKKLVDFGSSLIVGPRLGSLCFPHDVELAGPLLNFLRVN